MVVVGAEENSEGTIVFADKRTCIHEKKKSYKTKKKNRKEQERMHRDYQYGSTK